MDQYNNQSQSGESDEGLSNQPTMFVRKDNLPQSPEEPKQSPQSQVEPADSAGYDFAPTIKRSAVPVEEYVPVQSPIPAPVVPPPPVYPQAANPITPPQQQPVAPPPQKGKSKVWLIVVIIVLLVICCCCVLLFLVPSMLGASMNEIFGNIMEGLPSP